MGDDALAEAVQAAAPSAQKLKDTLEREGSDDSEQESDDDRGSSSASSGKFARDGDFTLDSDDDNGREDSEGEGSDADGSFNDEEDLLTGGRKLKKARSDKVDQALSQVIRFVYSLLSLNSLSLTFCTGCNTEQFSYATQ